MHNLLATGFAQGLFSSTGRHIVGRWEMGIFTATLNEGGFAGGVLLALEASSTFLTQPIVHNGRVFVLSTEGLHCYRIAKRS